MSNTPTRIIHCLRAPVGGAFRHIRDLARAQEDMGCRVGVLCDDSHYGELNERHLNELRRDLSLGLHRIRIPREIGLGDVGTLSRAAHVLCDIPVDILHGHTAKGGLIARGAGVWLRRQRQEPVASVYSPHGGSLHFNPRSIKGRLIFGVERALERATSGLIFVSRFEAEAYASKVGEPTVVNQVIHNGVWPEEFEPIPINRDAASFLFIGELRELKGPDLFLQAIARLHANGADVSAVMIGSGPDRDKVAALRDDLGLTNKVRIEPPKPIRAALAEARHLVMPSRAESLPYVVIETIAAGRPLVATKVGGIPEIFGELSTSLVEPDDIDQLTVALASVLDDPRGAHERAERLQMHARRRFSVAVMASRIDELYQRALLSAAPRRSSVSGPALEARDFEHGGEAVGRLPTAPHLRSLPRAGEQLTNGDPRLSGMALARVNPPLEKTKTTSLATRV